jgi:hypothetical protein
VIGEMLEEGGDITGARVVDKSKPGRSSVEYRLELWTATKDAQKNAAIRDRLLAALQEVTNKNFCTQKMTHVWFNPTI